MKWKLKRNGCMKIIRKEGRDRKRLVKKGEQWEFHVERWEVRQESSNGWLNQLGIFLSPYLSLYREVRRDDLTGITRLSCYWWTWNNFLCFAQMKVVKSSNSVCRTLNNVSPSLLSILFFHSLPALEMERIGRKDLVRGRENKKYTYTPKRSKWLVKLMSNEYLHILPLLCDLESFKVDDCENECYWVIPSNSEPLIVYEEKYVNRK